VAALSNVTEVPFSVPASGSRVSTTIRVGPVSAACAPVPPVAEIRWLQPASAVPVAVSGLIVRPATARSPATIPLAG
jgi:hypothetical protein